MNLFTKKPLDRLLAESEGVGEKGAGLKRTLSATSLVALGVGAIIGAGIFTLTGVAAATHAGPALVYSFILAAVGCAFAGFCYSEFSTMIPKCPRVPGRDLAQMDPTKRRERVMRDSQWKFQLIGRPAKVLWRARSRN